MVMATITYTDSALRYLGRWRDTGTAMRGCWQSPYVKFKFSGTSLSCVLDSVTTAAANEVYVYLDGAAIGNVVTVTSGSNKTVTLASSLSDTTHEVIIRFCPLESADIFGGSAYLQVKSFTATSFTAWNDGDARVLVIGDSISELNRTYALQMDGWEPYMVAVGGYSSTTALAQYPYKASGVAHTDPDDFDAIVIFYGTNDAVASVANATFKSNIGSLIDLVRADHATTPIYLVQGLHPQTIGTANPHDFDRYGTVLSELATEKSNVVYIPTGTLNATMTYPSIALDPYQAHPDTAGMGSLADHIVSYLPSMTATTDSDSIDLSWIATAAPYKLERRVV